MERQNRFDEAIKAKVGLLEDEPSARVWAGVQGAMSITVRPPMARTWMFRAAAAVTVLAVVGLGSYIYMSGGAATQDASRLSARARTPRVKVVPLDRTGKQDVFLTQDQQQQPAPQGRVVKFQPSMAHHDHLPSQDSVRPNMNPFPTPAPDPGFKEEVIVKDEAPVRNTPAPTPLNPGADREPQEVRVEPQPVLASNSTKRTFRVPGREDLKPENLRGKSGAILGAVANGAHDYLGLKTGYTEQKEEDLKMTAFNADFGLFKIKKVKTVKQ